jgi:hypothetical protein
MRVPFPVAPTRAGDHDVIEETQCRVGDDGSKSKKDGPVKGEGERHADEIITNIPPLCLLDFRSPA